MIIDNPIVSGSLDIQNDVTASNLLLRGTASGVFSGSFLGDGSQLSGVTSYTDSDTLTYINTLGVLSGSAQIASDISGSFTDLSSSIQGRVAAQESFSSSLSTTELTLSGSFSGSFIGDGSQLSGVTSYTDSDTLAFINSKTVLSGSIAELTSVTASFLNTGSVTIPHGFNSKNVSIAVYDDSDILIIPQEIALVSNNAVKVTFGGLTSGFAVVAKGGHIVSGSVPVPQLSTVADSFTSTTSHTVTHNFNTKNVIVSVYEGDNYIIPDTITTPTDNTVEVTFPEAISGRVVVVKSGHIVSGSIPYSNLSNTPTLLSSSAQIASDISGSFTSLSSSFQGRISTNEDNIGSLTASTSSYALKEQISGSFTSVSQSFASERLKNTTDTLDGDLTVTGTITAQEFHTEFVSSSIIYQSGSTQFGDTSDDTHIFTGTVGIGTSSPSTLLTADLGASGNIAHFEGNSNVHLRIGESSGDMYLNANNGNATIAFQTNTVERMRIDSSGNLNFSTADGVGITFKESGFITIDSDNNDSSRNFQFKDGSGSTLMTLLDTGNVGIGITDPQNRLSLGSTQGSGIDFLYDATNTYKNQIKNYWNSSTDTRMDFNIGRTANVTPVTVMSVGYNSNVGIGTTSPTEKLEVNGTGRFTNSSTAIGIILNRGLDVNSVGEAGVGMQLGALDGSTYKEGVTMYGSLKSNGDDGGFTVQVRKSNVMQTRFTINEDGNVGIGTTSPSSGAKLDVNGSLAIANTGQLNLTRTLDTNNLWYGMRYDNDEVQIYTYYPSNRSITFNTVSGGTGITNQLMKIEAGGNVGIGTTSPEQKMHIEGASLTVNRANDDSSVAFQNSATNATWRIGRDYSNSEALTFAYSVSGYPSLTGNTITVIDTSGNIGIGTSSPAAKLDVYGSSNSADNMIELINSKYDSTDTTGETGILFGWNNHVAARITAFKEGTVNRTGFKIIGEAGFNVPTTIATFRSTGLVGIGTTSPSDPLHILSSTNITRFESSTTGLYNTYKNSNGIFGYVGTGSQTVSGGGSDDFGIQSANNFVIATGGNTERMRITSGGQVNIGYNGTARGSVNTVLMVGKTGATYLEINGGDTSGQGGLLFADGSGGAYGLINYLHASDEMQFYTAEAERMLITSSGIIQTNVTKPLGSDTPNLRLKVTPTGTNYSSGAYVNIVFGDETVTNSYLGDIQVVQGDPSISTATTMRFLTNSGGGNAATQERMRILPSGGITFNGDTSTSNALDDYEEGTWTPTFPDAGNVSSVAISGTAVYTKIGRIVHLALEVSGQFISTGTESLFSFTLPFTAASTTMDHVGTATFFIGTGANRFGMGSVFQGTTTNSKTYVYIPAREVQQSGTWGQMRISLTYFAL